MRVGCCAAALTLWLAIGVPARAADEARIVATAIDAGNTQVEFGINALWLLHRHGRFAQIEGRVQIDRVAGSARIGVRIRVDSVQMKDPDHERLLMSPAFFDAGRHPWIEFESEAFALSGDAQVVLPGQLRLRGVSRKVRLQLDRSDCLGDPARACTVIVSGSLRRSRFGMRAYRRTLSDKVQLRITAQLQR